MSSEYEKSSRWWSAWCLRRVVTLTLCSILLSSALWACAPRTLYIPAKIDPRLTEEIPDPPLRAPTYRGAIIQSVERAEVIRRWNCRAYVLRGEALPDECTGAVSPSDNPPP